MAGRRGGRQQSRRVSGSGCGPSPNCLTRKSDPCLGLTYLSDMFLVSTALAVHGLPGARRDIESASLDHAIGSTGRPAVDDWVLYEQGLPTVQRRAGLVPGRLLDRPAAWSRPCARRSSCGCRAVLRGQVRPPLLDRHIHVRRHWRL